MLVPQITKILSTGSFPGSAGWAFEILGVFVIAKHIRVDTSGEIWGDIKEKGMEATDLIFFFNIMYTNSNSTMILSLESEMGRVKYLSQSIKYNWFSPSFIPSYQVTKLSIHF